LTGGSFPVPGGVFRTLDNVRDPLSSASAFPWASGDTPPRVAVVVANATPGGDLQTALAPALQAIGWLPIDWRVVFVAPAGPVADNAAVALSDWAATGKAAVFALACAGGGARPACATAEVQAGPAPAPPPGGAGYAPPAGTVPPSVPAAVLAAILAGPASGAEAALLLPAGSAFCDLDPHALDRFALYDYVGAPVGGGGNMTPATDPSPAELLASPLLRPAVLRPPAVLRAVAAALADGGRGLDAAGVDGDDLPRWVAQAGGRPAPRDMAARLSPGVVIGRYWEWLTGGAAVAARDACPASLAAAPPDARWRLLLATPAPSPPAGGAGREL
jgi:hypothetical protein